MKTIEERAKELYPDKSGIERVFLQEIQHELRAAYIAGATEAEGAEIKRLREEIRHAHDSGLVEGWAQAKEGNKLLMTEAAWEKYKAETLKEGGNNP